MHFVSLENPVSSVGHSATLAGYQPSASVVARASGDRAAIKTRSLINVGGLHTLWVPGEIKRREVELDPQVSPEEIVSREVELSCGSWTLILSLRVVPQQQCNGHCPCDSAQYGS